MILDKEMLERRMQQTLESSSASGENPVKLPTHLWKESSTAINGEPVSAHELSVMNHTWTVRADRPISSHRRTVGRWIVIFKKVVRKCTSWYVDSTFVLQTNFNATVTRLINELAGSIKNLSLTGQQNSEGIEHLVAQVSELSNEKSKLEIQLDDLRKQIANLHTNLTRVDMWSPDWLFRNATDFNYEDFQNHFRGDTNTISNRLSIYLQMFENSSGPIVDLGCGRGEFVELCRSKGIEAIGVDVNDSEIMKLKQRGHNAINLDALGYLLSQTDDSVGGILLTQVVEHLPFGQVIRIVKESYRVLKPGGKIIIESVNPQSLFVFTHALYVDPSHLRPVHPLTLEYCLQAQGYEGVRIGYQSQVEDEQKLIGTDRNIDLLNSTLYGAQDFYVVGQKRGYDNEN